MSDILKELGFKKNPYGGLTLKLSKKVSLSNDFIFGNHTKGELIHLLKRAKNNISNDFDILIDKVIKYNG